MMKSNDVMKEQKACVDGEEGGSTFWTVCPRCDVRHQYYKAILVTCLRCPSCYNPFIAYDVDAQVVKPIASWSPGPPGFHKVITGHRGGGVTSSFAPKNSPISVKKEDDQATTSIERLYREEMGKLRELILSQKSELDETKAKLLTLYIKMKNTAGEKKTRDGRLYMRKSPKLGRQWVAAGLKWTVSKRKRTTRVDVPRKRSKSSHTDKGTGDGNLFVSDMPNPEVPTSSPQVALLSEEDVTLPASLPGVVFHDDVEEGSTVEPQKVVGSQESVSESMIGNKGQDDLGIEKARDDLAIEKARVEELQRLLVASKLRVEELEETLWFLEKSKAILQAHSEL